MAQRQIRLSIRYKLLLLLTSLPLVSLGLYVLMATRLFEKDKIAYVFDSSVAVSRSLAVQTRMEIESIVHTIKPMLESYDFDKQKFADTTKELFEKQNDVISVTIMKPNPTDGTFQLIGQLSHRAVPPLTITNQILQIATDAYKKGLSMLADGTEGRMLFAQRIGDVGGSRTIVQLTAYNSHDLFKAFSLSGLYTSFLITPKGQIVLGPREWSETLFQGRSTGDIFSLALNSQTSDGTGEVSLTQNDKILMSYSRVAAGDFLVVSVVDKKDALQAVRVLVTKSLMFFLALLASTIIISLIASVQLTSTLQQLFVATKKVANGDFDIKIKDQTDDEIGVLADSFNLMAHEVSRLLSETAEKARMANELATVKTVQETLFPEAQNKFGNFEIAGHFEPASECGGDWWNYCLMGDKLCCWIGDATGHGAPSALITGAARSAASIIELLPGMTPARAMQIMNRAIHETSKGKIMMTFFIAMIDLRTGVMTYSNASHDPPYLIRNPFGRKPSRKELLPLVEKSGFRLGDQPRAQYQDVTLQLEPGDLIFFYTDGLLDIINPEGKNWGERKFLDTLGRCVSSKEHAKERLEEMKLQIQTFRQNAQLLDDVTLFICQYEKPENVGKAVA